MSLIKSGRIAVLYLLTVIIVFGETSFSQEEPQSNSDCKHCLNAKRYPACCSYWVTDAGIGIFTSSSHNQYSSNIMLFADLGYMVNLNEKTSIGGTLFGAADEDRARAGVRFRYRRWLNNKTTLDFSPGVLLLGADDYSGTSSWPAFIATTHVSYNSRISAYVGMEIFGVKSNPYPYFVGTPVISQKSTETSFFVGAGLGQEAGLVGYGVFGGLIVLAIGISSSFD